MPADNTLPIHKHLAAEAKEAGADPINLAIAREVLQRVREGKLPNPRQENNPIAD